MASVTRDDIAAALSAIMDEDSGKDVVSAGLIQGLVVREGHVGFSLEVDPKKGAQKEPLRKACEEAVKRLPGVLSVTAVLTAHRDSASPSAGKGHSHSRAHDHSHGGEQQRTSQGAMQIPGVKAIIAVASGKGGVGKSTVAVNLALALSKLGRRVGLLDADIYGPSIPRMMGLKGKPESKDGKKLLPKEKYGIRTMSIGYLVNEDTPMIWRGPMVQSALTQMMSDVEWGELDVLVVDMPPGTGDAQLTMAQRVPLTGAVVVSTPQEIALIDARKGFAMFEKTHVPVFGIVENMAYFVSPGSGEKSYIFGEGGARRMAEKLGCDFLGEVPLHMTIREKSDSGEPVVATAPDSDEAKPFLEIARRVGEHLDRALGEGARKGPRISIED
ncbi:iron-sulfur cluster carrier protein ApbC [Parvibaculum sp.]|uniref:iron-sulfur cluster carrier protein ApbC n=1 Tax=Parvibaculum sp. TaxID=2024848 RepID=UPI000EE1926D|nr:iron-sulfur cluster carrier protein ApbC [Parvibaculum sp.]MBO6668868.1 iron-sulfur cluster carrier protein ApbC [Parvibaculum sp.]MBO6692421.1 iron-sulfur cluster carrier protein ApbC [Parvibaculum sp.]MBO6715728.1 iron-sulfur cluster carrier protein ApbC [Parvibaculum sp.]HAC56941.1 iron-sulfur cluster carrier protein ApbC [Rhodobiaceae bacterium]